MIRKNNDQKIESYDYDPGVNMELKTPKERYLNEHYYHLIVEFMLIALVKNKIDVSDIREIINLVLEKYRNYQLEIMEDDNG